VDGRYVTVPAGSSAPSGGFQRQHMVGSLAYMAPEVLMRRVATYDADAYAFGVYACEGAFCHLSPTGPHTTPIAW
jgi:serine/threonine protein kinase